jgi:hypothetical protein
VTSADVITRAETKNKAVQGCMHVQKPENEYILQMQKQTASTWYQLLVVLNQKLLIFGKHIGISLVPADLTPGFYLFIGIHSYMQLYPELVSTGLEIVSLFSTPIK